MSRARHPGARHGVGDPARRDAGNDGPAGGRRGHRAPDARGPPDGRRAVPLRHRPDRLSADRPGAARSRRGAARGADPPGTLHLPGPRRHGGRRRGAPLGAQAVPRARLVPGAVGDRAGRAGPAERRTKKGGTVTSPPQPRRRLSRVLRILVPVTILGVILLAVSTVGFIEYSARPSFCDNCHIMQPYYDSWKTSSHNQVACIKCHYAPGIRAEAMGKLQAANQVVKYVTGAYGMKPWAEIEDAACLRSGCHSERKVEGLVDYAGVSFDHTEHLGELRRGKQLRCTSCHSQIVQGEHLAVTPVTCFLCHFKDRPAGDPVAGCTGCHPSPPRVVSPAGYVVDHAQYVRDRI